MTLTEIRDIFFAIDIFYNNDYDIIKYNYKVPSAWHKSKREYGNNFKYKFNEFLYLNKTDIKTLAVINQMKYKSNKCVDNSLSKNDITLFQSSIINHVSFFCNDIDKIVENCVTYYDVFDLYQKRLLQWYSFLMIPKFLKFKIGQDNKIIMKEDLKRCVKTAKLFKLNYEKMDECTMPLKHKYEIGSFKIN